jgi:hypothetical protein
MDEDVCGNTPHCTRSLGCKAIQYGLDNVKVRWLKIGDLSLTVDVRGSPVAEGTFGAVYEACDNGGETRALPIHIRLEAPIRC